VAIICQRSSPPSEIWIPTEISSPSPSFSIHLCAQVVKLAHDFGFLERRGHIHTAYWREAGPPLFGLLPIGAHKAGRHHLTLPPPPPPPPPPRAPSHDTRARGATRRNHTEAWLLPCEQIGFEPVSSLAGNLIWLAMCSCLLFLGRFWFCHDRATCSSFPVVFLIRFSRRRHVSSEKTGHKLFWISKSAAWRRFACMPHCMLIGQVSGLTLRNHF
jgi:hypothetical protein